MSATNILYWLNVFLMVLWGTLCIIFGADGPVLAFAISLVTVTILTVLRVTNAGNGAWR